MHDQLPGGRATEGAEGLRDDVAHEAELPPAVDAADVAKLHLAIRHGRGDGEAKLQPSALCFDRCLCHLGEGDGGPAAPRARRRLRMHMAAQLPDRVPRAALVERRLERLDRARRRVGRERDGRDWDRGKRLL